MKKPDPRESVGNSQLPLMIPQELQSQEIMEQEEGNHRDREGNRSLDPDVVWCLRHGLNPVEQTGARREMGTRGQTNGPHEVGESIPKRNPHFGRSFVRASRGQDTQCTVHPEKKPEARK
jgi:hypothetical protein